MNLKRALVRNLGTYGSDNSNQLRKDKASAEVGRQRIADRRKLKRRNVRARVLKQDIGAERLVVVMKSAKADGAKGARYLVSQNGQLKG